uniref:Glutamate receptor ionotropic, kainate 2 n=1 Tax=Strigamia maritima TaxID=126957 RepID=T1IYW2_STRMM
MNQRTRILLLLLTTLRANSLPENITIGGLFDSQDETLEIAFRYAVEKVNYLRWLLPKSRLLTHVEKLEHGDSFMASQKVCSMLKNGVAAFFGPQSEMTTSTVQSICDTLEIPHIETRWDYRMRREDYSLNLYPHPGKLSEVLAEIVKKFDWWNTFAVLYEDSDSLARVQDILKLAKKDYHVVSWQLPEGNNYREVFRDMKRNAQFRIVLDCSVEILPEVLKQAQQIGMMSDSYEYFITNLDMQTIDYEDFKYSGTNITGIRLLDPNKRDVRAIVSEWKFGEYQKRDPKAYNITENNLRAEAALMYDAVMLFATALTDLDLSNKIDIRPLSCDSNDAWAHGNSLINYMKLVQTSEHLPTLTGRLKFDPEGFRTDFHIDVIKLTAEGFLKIGYWSSSMLNITWPPLPQPDPADERIVYNVSVKFGPPYFMNRTSNEVLTGNDRYEGYVVDLVEKVAQVANFSYRFVPVPDDQYGSRLDDNTWNGQIGEILNGHAQIAVGDLTITSSREEVVDFSTPFMNLGITLLFRAKEKQKPELFSFLSPFSVEVWIYMLAAYSGVSCVLFILARFSPYEWDNPYPCITDPDSLENNFTLLNSLWFTIGTVMQQGSDVAPRATSTRIVGAMWSFFTLIIISSYTANLAAFLMLEPSISPIDVIEDLTTQTKIKYGCVKGGSTYGFFATTPMYKAMFEQMKANPDVIVDANPNGVDRVKNTDDYAFFMESTSVDYTTVSTCGLRKVVNKLGSNLDSKGYGMAVNKTDPLRGRLTSAILKLQEEEELEGLRKTWWEEKSKVQCDAESISSGSSNKALSMSHVGGVFVVLIGGMGFACVIAIVEFMWNIRNSVKEGRGSLCSELMNDLKFVVKCRGSTKPVRKPIGDGDRASNSTSVGTGLGGPYNGFQN